MSQENVELVREGFARWNKGDYDFLISAATPDVELHSRFGKLTGEPYRGRSGCAQVARGYRAELRAVRPLAR